MKKIFKSVAVIVAVASLASVATISFFADTEVSTGNTFTAGGVDLQVDSEAHYNNLVCQGGFWVDNSSCEETGSNLIENGSFEKPVVATSEKWDVFDEGDSDLDWNVEWESTETSFGGQTRPSIAPIELHKGVLGPAAEGEQSAELDSDWFGPTVTLDGEPASVSIHQNVPTTAGTKYVLKYEFAPRPNTSSSENQLSVRIDGTQVSLKTQTGGSNVDWTEFEEIFIADGATTRIEFADVGTPNSLGTFLDDVRVYELECVETSVPELVGQPCDGTWTLSDLGPTTKFFNFGDIKPGDFGENTVSLHVLDNDAYACLLFDNVENNENDLIDPEEEAGDDSPGDSDGKGEGELAENLEFFAWIDDGDNIWEENEVPLFNPIVGTGEALLNGKVYPLFTPQTGPLATGDIKYIGLTWCAGSLDVDETDHEIDCDGSSVGNDAQTDSFLADLTFYVEQTRHNDDFTCTDLER